MRIDVGRIESLVRTVDSDSVLTAKSMARIVREVINYLDDREEHRARIRAEQRITRGVRYELEEQ